MNWMLFVLAAGFGGYLRYKVEHKFQPIVTTGFPKATLAVNLIGAFLLGLVFTAPNYVPTLVGIAFCGALTTFSGVSAQLMRQIITGSYSKALIYISITIVGGLTFAELGLYFGKLIFS